MPQFPTNTSAVKRDFSSNSRTMLIAFASKRLTAPVPPFEWTGALAAIPAKKMYVRDLYQLWYLLGFPGVADSPHEAAAYLKHLVDENKCDRIVTLGGSMGGYAALLFGCLLQADAVHAFGGQTFLPTRRGRYLAQAIAARDWPSLRKDWQVRSQRATKSMYFDLKPLLEQGSSQTRYHLYYSHYHGKDVMHAQNIAGLPNVCLHERENKGHHMGVALRDSGELEQILLNAVAEES
jgi:pimeloyl-ACP methyl ester carboxylesterase